MKLNAKYIAEKAQQQRSQRCQHCQTKAKKRDTRIPAQTATQAAATAQ